MRVVIVAVGTLGDVAPYTGLGSALEKAGHSVAIATHATYEDVVCAAGFEFLPLAGDPRQALAGSRGRKASATSVRGLRHLFAMVREQQRALGADIVAAAAGADMLLLSVGAFLGWHIAQGLGIRSAGIFLQPWTPTADFAPAMATTRSFGGMGNKAAARLMLAGGQWPMRGVVNDLRAGLGLPVISPAQARRQMESEMWPIFYGFSPTVVPPPSDWPAWNDVVGYWWPKEAPGWSPPSDLVEFLGAGDAPVYIGFGSMQVGEPERISQIVGSAVREAGVRAVVHMGDVGLAVQGPDVMAIGGVPHSWLFPQMAAVVHHCGAGTTAAALRAGVPTVPVPVMADQPFWAKRLRALGVAAPALNPNRLTVSGLATAISTTLSDTSMQERARVVAAQISSEDGAGRLLRSLESDR